MIRPALLALTLCLSTPALASTAPIEQNFGAQAEEVGSSKYRKLCFSVYRVTLFSTDGQYDAAKPYALQVHYLRSLSKDTVVDAVVEDVRKQKLADTATMDKWEKLLTDALPAVKNGDKITGVHVPGQPAVLYYNGKKVASISDERLSQAFFNIWLGKVADPDTRKKLMGANAL